MPFKAPTVPPSNTLKIDGAIQVDAFSHVATINPDAFDITAAVIVSAEGTPIGTQPEINFIEGSGVTITVTDNGGADRVDVEIEATSSPSVIVSAEGTPEGIRPEINFIEGPGIALTVTDDAGNNRVDVEIEAIGADVIVSAEGTPVGTQPEINFIEGSGVTLTLTNDVGNSRVDVEISASNTGAAALHKFDNTGSPIVRYDFEENGNDSSGNALNLSTITTPVYGEVWPNVIGLVGGSLGRAANDAALTITGDITIELLCVLRVTPVTAIPVSFFDRSAPNTLGGNVLYQLAFTDHATLSFLSESAVNTFSTLTATAGRRLPQFGVPCHVVARRTSNVCDIWLNGRAFGAASGTLTAPTNGTTSKLEVRVNNVASTPDIFGLRIYNSARTDQQIKDAFNATLGQAFGTV